MKKYIVKTSLGLLLFTTLFVACTDSFVDREPVYSIDSENYFNSEDGNNFSDFTLNFSNFQSMIIIIY